MNDTCCDTEEESCRPFTKVYEKCAVVDCEYVTVVVTETTAANCVQTTVITLNGTVLPADTQLFVCKEPTPVIPVCKPKTVFDREMEKLCHPDGTKVLVQDVTPEDAPLGTAPTLNFWTLANPSVPYTGDTTLLKDCGAEKIDIKPSEWFCANGAPMSRADVFDISTSPISLISVIWQDVSGAVVPAPAAGSYVVGDCSCVDFTPAQRGIQSTW